MSAALNNWPGRMSEDDAQDAREEAIADRAQIIAPRLIADGDFCGNALIELGWDEGQASILEMVGRFAADFEVENNAGALAVIGFDLFKGLKPYLAAAAKYQAESDARDEIAREEAAHRDDALKAKAA
jgi:hypothetical protein